MPASNALELENFLPYRLNRLADAFSRDFSRIYKDRFGLTRPEWRLLATLGQYGTMTATAVGQHSSMHKTKVSRAVTELERRRWLSRAENPLDRRIDNLTLTRAGMDAYRDLVPLAHGYEESLLASLSTADRKRLLDGLAILEGVVLRKGG